MKQRDIDLDLASPAFRHRSVVMGQIGPAAVINP